ncbi:MAG: hypothetical protein M1831_000295 [Alyxoria varia]|nr:MAG: hypothetical protein M1831_000295 [Alyxoria varia]
MSTKLTTRTPESETPSSSVPATPILASTLLSQLRGRSSNRPKDAASASAHAGMKRKRAVDTGLGRTVDNDVLRSEGFFGGAEGGRAEGGIVGLAIGAGAGGKGGGGIDGDVLLHRILAAHLLPQSSDEPHSPDTTNCKTTSSPPQLKHRAFYIDPNSSFSPHLLHDLLQKRLTACSKSGFSDQDQSHERREQMLTEALDNVNVMRVFDIEGAMECISEIAGEAWIGSSNDERTTTDQNIGQDAEPAMMAQESGGKTSTARQKNAAARPESQLQPRSDEEAQMIRRDEAVANAEKETRNTAPPRHKAEIADSEDEEDAEMLLDLDPPANDSQHHAVNPSSEPPAPLAAPSEQPQPARTSPPPSPSPPAHKPTQEPQQQNQKAGDTMILLPSLSTLITPLIRRNSTRGHALLVHLLRSLRHLTRNSALHTGTGTVTVVIGNTVVPVFTPHSRNSASAAASTLEEGVSAFASAGVKPALGATFAEFLDLSLMVWWGLPAPQNGNGDRTPYVDSKDGGAGGGKGKGVIVECVRERGGGRVGRWGVLGD